MEGHGLAQWLAGRDAAQLTTLLERRPDVVFRRPPATLQDLAERLEHPAAVRAALRGLTAPAVQTMEALQALGEWRTRIAVVDLLAGAGRPEHEAAVDEVLAELTVLALVWPGAGDRLEVPSGLSEVFPSPFGLGPPLRQLWQEQSSDEIGKALRALGGRPLGKKAEKLEALLALLTDVERIRELVSHAPPEIAEGLRRMAWGGVDDQDDVVLRFDPVVYRELRETERWGIERGLLVGRSWGPAAPMPAEVALALRGPEFSAPFDPSPPALPPRTAAPEAVASAAAGAVTTFLSQALALLDRLARAPVPRLAGGGIGVRELARLSKELGIEETVVRLVLELASVGGLIDTQSDGVTVSDVFTAWRTAEPATQAAGLLAAWWLHPAAPTRPKTPDGKAVPALRPIDPCGGCQAARRVLVEVAASLPPGAAAGTGALSRLAHWNRPLVHVLPQDADAPLASVAAEAELLGVLAAGAPSPLAAALVVDDLDAVRDHLRRLLPEASDSAIFGSDLTALVAGTPSARVTALLDGCADRESSGGAIIWRFGPATVRRALDAGTSAEELIGQLGTVAQRELPQPLTYLINDVGRRHGRVRVQPAMSLIRSEDEALLAEMAADRRLARLGLRPVAATVLACQVSLEEALERLREVGYFPVPDRDAAAAAAAPPGRSRTGQGRTGQGRTGRGRTGQGRTGQGRTGQGRGSTALASTALDARRRPAPQKPEPEQVDHEELARRLLSTTSLGQGERAESRSPTFARLAHQAAGLAAWEVDHLADAVERGGRVEIDYRSATGARTRRVICDPELVGSALYAWCELRQDERLFTVSRILAVAPAD